MRGWPWGGAALVGGSQGLQALERRRQAVVRCMQARGHGGPPYAAVVAPAVARPHPSVPVVPAAPTTGADGYSAERLALGQACHSHSMPTAASSKNTASGHSVSQRRLAARC